MDADENEICQFLKSWPGQFVSGKTICRRAGGKWRFREDENWAVPILRRMLDSSLVEADETGHYRLQELGPPDKHNRKKLWIAPAIKAILRQSGGNFGVIDLDQEGEVDDLMPSSEPSARFPLEG
jgi:hypothetical protein